MSLDEMKLEHWRVCGCGHHRNVHDAVLGCFGAAMWCSCEAYRERELVSAERRGERVAFLGPLLHGPYRVVMPVALARRREREEDSVSRLPGPPGGRVGRQGPP
jgi:hypothetical protein